MPIALPNSFVGEVIGKVLGAFGDILLGQVGIDLSHRSQVIPASDLRRYHLWDLEVVSKACKAVTETVKIYLRETVGFADDLYMVQDCIPAHSDYMT